MNFLPHASAAPSRESIHQARKRAMRSTREADADVDSSSQRERELSVESFSSASSASLAPHNAAAAGGSARHSRQRTRSSPLADDSEQDSESQACLSDKKRILNVGHKLHSSLVAVGNSHAAVLERL